MPIRRSATWGLLAGLPIVLSAADPGSTAGNQVSPSGQAEGRERRAAADGAGRMVRVPVPADVPVDALSRADAALRSRLHRLTVAALLVDQHADAPGAALRQDAVVVFVDGQGRPVRPDLDEARARHAAAGPAPLGAGTALTFTFDSPDSPWTAQEIASLTTALADFQAAAHGVYGDPAFSITVNIRKDPALPYVGLYNSTLNEMALLNASNLDVVCHEMIHAFRDDAIIGIQSFEEGMTRAAEVEVFNQLAAYTHGFDEHHSYPYDVYYELLNREAIGSTIGWLHAGFNPFLKYQLTGYAWAKALLENAAFLSDFNANFYPQELADPATSTNEATLRAIATGVQPTVEGIPFQAWYDRQLSLDNSPPTGEMLYQRGNQFTVDVFTRNPTGGQETAVAGRTVSWQVFDAFDTLLSSGSATTSSFGSISFSPTLPAGYAGRLKVVATTTGPSGTLTDVVYRQAAAESGVFGVASHGNGGTVVLTPLDDPSAAAVTVPVVDGAFYAAGLETVRGRVQVSYTDGAGTSLSRLFTKDASEYFALLRPQVTVTASDSTAAEAPLNTGRFTFARTGGTDSALVVRYTAGGTATAGSDYTTLSGQVTIPAGAASVNVTLTPLNDTAVEGIEVATATLLPQQTYEIGSPASASVSITSDDSLADMTVSSLTGVPATAARGQALSLTVVSANTGTAASAPTTTRVWGSTNNSVGAGDVLLASIAVPGLLAGGSHTQPVSTAVPANAPAGTYFIIAEADGGKVIGEPNETNNRRAVSTRLGPDLVVTSITVPGSAAAGGTMSVTFVTRNQGAEGAAASTARLVLSADATFDANDARLSLVSIGTLAAGASVTRTVTVTIPSNVSFNFRIIAQADALTQVAESVETNNTRASSVILLQ